MRQQNIRRLPWWTALAIGSVIEAGIVLIGWLGGAFEGVYLG